MYAIAAELKYAVLTTGLRLALLGIDARRLLAVNILAAVGVILMLAANHGSTITAGYFGMAAITSATVIAKPSSKLSKPHLALIGLFYIAAIGSAFWGIGNVYMSWLLAFTATLGYLLYRLPLRETFWHWLVAGAYLNAGFAIWQGFQHFRDATYRAEGFLGNANLAAGYLDIAIVYLMAKGKWYLTAPLFIALHLTGSRLGVWALLLVLAAMLLKGGIIPKRVLLIVVGSMAAAAVLFWPQAQRIYFNADMGYAPGEIREELANRFTMPERMGMLPGAIPQGYPGDFGVHSVPLQLFFQVGVPGLFLAAYLFRKALQRPKYTPYWWVLIMMLAVSTLDYYMIMYPMALLLWAALSMQAESPKGVEV